MIKSTFNGRQTINQPSSVEISMHRPKFQIVSVCDKIKCKQNKDKV